MRLGNTIGDRINLFDSLDSQTVETFNSIFIECPIKGCDPTALVIIGAPCQNNCREITVGGPDYEEDDTFEHKMYSDVLYTLDREEFYFDERDKELEEINGVQT